MIDVTSELPVFCFANGGGWLGIGVKLIGVDGPRDGDERGVTDDVVTRVRNVSSCFSVSVLCRVSSGRTLGTCQPSMPTIIVISSML